MENKNKILLAIGAIAAAYFGKKHLDKRKGSGAIFPLYKNMSPEAAFAAWSQRRAGLAPWEDAADARMARNSFIMKYSVGGRGAYDAARFGPDSENQKEWDRWLAENKDDYARMQMLLGNHPAAKFSGTPSSDSSVMSGTGAFKDGYSATDPSGAFDGTGSDSSSALSGQGTLKQEPMSPAGRYGKRGGYSDPFSPFGYPSIDDFK